MTDVDTDDHQHGLGLEGLPDEKHVIARFPMLRIGGAAPFATPNRQAAIHGGRDGHRRVVLHDYPSEEAGFETERGAPHSAAAGSRIEAFFAEHLA